jgi:hypothetical protein
MQILSILLESIYTFFRSFSFFAVIISFLGGFFLSNWNYVLLGIFLISDIITNATLKTIFKFLMGNRNFPIIGIGLRPYKNKECGFFTSKTNYFSESYGMPSGHSQSFSFISTLIALHAKDDLKTILLFILTCTAMYMRVYVEKCHTIQQTIIGSFIGVSLAFILSYYFGNPFD